MNINRKGFTLIELLAVIVILAVIMLITIPTVGSLVEKARKEAFKNSAYGIISAVEQKYMLKELNYQEGALIIEYENGKLISEENLDYKGGIIDTGKILIIKSGEVALAIHNGKYCAEKWYTDKVVKLSDKTKDRCVIPFPCGEDLRDARDNNIYRTVKIGDQCWFADNLRYTGSGCLDNVWDNDEPHNACSIGNTSWGEEVLYQWGAAMNESTIAGSQGLCPVGWHIPTSAEWKVLKGTVDSTYGVGDSKWNLIGGYQGDDVGEKLKSSIYWNGTNNYGFNAVPSYNNSSSAQWWTSSTYGTLTINNQLSTIQSGIFLSTNSRYSNKSVRCIYGW